MELNHTCKEVNSKMKKEGYEGGKERNKDKTLFGVKLLQI